MAKYLKKIRPFVTLTLGNCLVTKYKLFMACLMTKKEDDLHAAVPAVIVGGKSNAFRKYQFSVVVDRFMKCVFFAKVG